MTGYFFLDRQKKAASNRAGTPILHALAADRPLHPAPLVYAHALPVRRGDYEFSSSCGRCMQSHLFRSFFLLTSCCHLLAALMLRALVPRLR